MNLSWTLRKWRVKFDKFSWLVSVVHVKNMRTTVAWNTRIAGPLSPSGTSFRFQLICQSSMSWWSNCAPLPPSADAPSTPKAPKGKMDKGDVQCFYHRRNQCHCRRRRPSYGTVRWNDICYRFVDRQQWKIFWEHTGRSASRICWLEGGRLRSYAWRGWSGDHEALGLSHSRMAFHHKGSEAYWQNCARHIGPAIPVHKILTR